MDRVREILEAMVASYFSGCSLAAQGQLATVQPEPAQVVELDDRDAEYATAVA